MNGELADAIRAVIARSVPLDECEECGAREQVSAYGIWERGLHALCKSCVGKLGLKVWEIRL